MVNDKSRHLVDEQHFSKLCFNLFKQMQSVIHQQKADKIVYQSAFSDYRYLEQNYLQKIPKLPSSTMLKDLILQQDPDRGSSDLIDLSNPQSNNNNSNINPNQNPNTTSNENFTNLNEELKNESVPFCFACGEIIRDRFYLLAVDRAWHANCLR